MKRLFLTLLLSALALLIIRDYAAFYRLQHGADQMAVLDAGLTALGLPYNKPDENGLILASASACPAPIIIGLFAIDGGENARVNALAAPGMHPLFIYLGTVRNRPDRWKNAIALSQALLHGMIGLHAKNIPTKMAVAILPDACLSLFGLNWTVLSPKPSD